MRQPSTMCSHTLALTYPSDLDAGYTGVCMGPLFPATKQALADSADQGGADSLTHIAAGAFSSRGRVHARCVGGAQSVEKKERSDIRTCISGYTQALIDSHRRRCVCVYVCVCACARVMCGDITYKCEPQKRAPNMCLKGPAAGPRACAKFVSSQNRLFGRSRVCSNEAQAICTVVCVILLLRAITRLFPWNAGFWQTLSFLYLYRARPSPGGHCGVLGKKAARPRKPVSPASGSSNRLFA